MRPAREIKARILELQQLEAQCPSSVHKTGVGICMAFSHAMYGTEIEILRWVLGEVKQH